MTKQSRPAIHEQQGLRQKMRAITKCVLHSLLALSLWRPPSARAPAIYAIINFFFLSLARLQVGKRASENNEIPNRLGQHNANIKTKRKC